MSESFITFLEKANIDPVKFRSSDPVLFAQWASEFEQLSPASFGQHKLFLLNKIRRKYPLVKYQ